MSKILDAINTLLVSIGEEQVVDLTEPSALMAKSTLDFVLAELPYTDVDFVIDYETLPLPVYNYVVVKGARKFQASAIASEILHAFTSEDELNAKRLLIRKGLIPSELSTEVEEELTAMMTYSDRVPVALKKNLGLLKLQALLFNNPEQYVISPDAVQLELLNLKKKLILTRDVPLEILQKIREQYYARYGFSGAIPLDVTVETDATQMLKAMASWEFQKAILPADQYVITPEEKLQDEMDFRLAIIANKLYPTDLYENIKDEFIGTYSILESEFTPVIEEYILNKTMFRLQSILIPTMDQRPITLDDMDNAEATLLARFTVPKDIYARALEEVKVELAIDELIPEEELPTAVINYVKYKSALLHQPTVIRYPSKYTITEVDVIKAKALANQSLPTLSLMDSTSVSRILERDLNPEAVTGTTSSKLRLSSIVEAEDDFEGL